MKYLIPLIAGLAISVTSVYAAPEGFIGTFNGTEKSILTNCGAYNGTTTGSWSIKHSDLKGSAFIGSGSNKDGNFTIVGETSDASAFGTTKGVNKWGLAWSGEFNATIQGSKYIATITGTVPSTGCKFTSEFDATKV